MEINKLSVTELKALAYDCFSRIELEQQNLSVINLELKKRSELPVKPDAGE